VTIKLGYQIPNFSYGTGIERLFPTVVEQAQEADAAGFDAVFVMDHFYQLPGLGAPEEPMLVENHAPNEKPAEAFAALQARDRQYLTDRAAGLPEVAEHNVRLYQPNKLPITERNAAVAALRANPDKITFGDSKGQVSQGGDLGFLWGEYRTQPTPDPTGYYLRIWRKDRAGEWKLALDLIHPR